ncbi:MAG: flippase activity-associated protein Agl23 [Chthoniobacterales bacterium]
MFRRQVLFPILILALAAGSRLAFLDVKPPHFDEGINGWFCDEMSKHGYYAYDSTNYHGPLHFYVLFVFLKFFGRNLWALRLPVVLVGTLTVYLVLLFRPFVGKTISYLAALGMAISPGFIFYSRYSIHETWLVFFLILTFWGALGLYALEAPKYVWAFVLGITGMILTKETYIIHVAAVGAAGLAALILERIRPSDAYLERSKSPVPRRHFAAAIFVGLALIVFFYSGNFLNWPGLKGLYQTFLPWTRTGIGAAGHGKPEYDLCPLVPSFVAHIAPFSSFSSFTINWYWIRLFLTYEWFVLAGLLFSVRYLFGGPIVLRYLAMYATATLFFYSIIPYKTPWCVISIAWPFLFLGGAFLEFIATRLNSIVAVLAGTALFGQAGWRSYKVNFVNFDNPKEMYVYVQTYRDYENFTDPILEKAARDPSQKKKLKGLILLSSYFPIPWVLGEFPNIGYYAKDDHWPEQLDTDFIAVEQSQASTVEAGLKDKYFVVDFRLRDGMSECSAYFRYSTFKDIFPDQVPGFDPSQPRE